ncbi:MAG: hypothetical protein OXC54_07935 [Rhodospirillaceae bacterium]|nr:hypothetical protein [Rhodospirillaceae bacterium]
MIARTPGAVLLIEMTKDGRVFRRASRDAITPLSNSISYSKDQQN